jgi:hypothetical protein
MDHHIKIPAPIVAEESKKARRVSDSSPLPELSELNFTVVEGRGYPLSLGYQILSAMIVSEA